MNSRMNLLFYLKKPKQYDGGAIDIYLRVTVAGRRTEFLTQRSCEPDKWITGAGRVAGTKETAREVNAYLDQLRLKVYEAHRKLSETGSDISLDTLREIITGKKTEQKMLIDIFRHHNAQMEKLVNIDFAPGTMERYRTALTHTQDFISWKYKQDDIGFNELNYEFVSEMEFYFKTVRRCCHNTSVKYISNVKKIVNICIKNGWLLRDPFFGYKMQKKEVIREFLTEEEIDRVYRQVSPLSASTWCVTSLSLAATPAWRMRTLKNSSVQKSSLASTEKNG